MLVTPRPRRESSRALIGRIGDSGETFLIGDRFEGQTGRDGRLYLQISSSPYDNAATGSFQVKVGVRD